MTLFAILLATSLFLIAKAVSSETCCRENGVSEYCAASLCNVQNIPGDVERTKLFEGRQNCLRYIPTISKCLSDERDVSSCCQKKAVAAENDYCFAMCNGTLKVSTSRGLTNFNSCFIDNAEPIYQCFEDAQNNAPSAPLNFRIAFKADTEIDFVWDPPAKNPDKVYLYKVYLVESKLPEDEATVHITHNDFVEITELSPKIAYTAYVIAHGKNVDGNPNYHRSTMSNVIHFTTTDNGIKEYEEEIKVPTQTKTVSLPCRLKAVIGGFLAIEWFKLSVGQEPTRLSHDRYSVNYYQSDGYPAYVVSSLKIADFGDSDYGIYRCQLKKRPTSYGEIKIVEHSYSDNAPAAEPPKTVEECCADSETDAPKRTVPISETNFLTPKKCNSELDTIFKCSLPQMNNAACCIHSNLPFHCLGMCDSKFNMEISKVRSCYSKLNQVYRCQAEVLNNLPGVVSSVKATSLSDGTFNFTWNASENAKVYHIYTKKNEEEWRSQVVTGTSANLEEVDEVTFVAVNDYGLSQQSRVLRYKGRWLYAD